MNTFLASRSYARVLEQFSRVVTVCRRRCRLQVDELSKLSNITVRRLRKYEAATAPPHWGDVLILSQVFGIRLSTLIASVRRPVSALTPDQYKRLLDYAHAHDAEQRQELRQDLKEDRRIHLEDTSDGAVHDATIADWPAFLLPSFDDALMAEGSRMHAVFRVLEALLKCNDDLTPLKDVIGMEVIDASGLLAKVHGVLGGVHARLDSLGVRHAEVASVGYVDDMDRQRSLITNAMELIACSLSEATPSDRDGSIGRNKYSVNLPGAMDRTLVASFGLIEIARSLRNSVATKNSALM